MAVVIKEGDEACAVLDAIHQPEEVREQWLRWLNGFGDLGNSQLAQFPGALGEVAMKCIDGIRYSSEPIQKSVLGFRAGMEGKFNRKFGMAYSGEIGYRPGLKDSGFFILAKISFPGSYRVNSRGLAWTLLELIRHFA